MRATPRLPAALAAAVLTASAAGCIKLPTGGNDAPSVPALAIAPDSVSYALPCTLITSARDADGDRIAFQFQVADLFGNAVEFPWSNYYRSDVSAAFAFTAGEGDYLLRVRGRDEMEAESGFSAWVPVSFVNAAPYAPDAPSGSAETFADVGLSFAARARDPEGDDISFRFDPGNGDAVSAWSPQQDDARDYAFAYTYTDAGAFALRVQARDAGGHVSEWSAGVHVTVRQNIEIAGSVGVPGGVLGIAARDGYAYLGTNGHGLQVVSLADPSAPLLLGGAGTVTSADVGVSGDGAFALASGSYSSTILHGFRVAPPAAPSQAGSLLLWDSHSLAVGDGIALTTTGPLDGRVHVVDVSDPDSMSVLASLSAGSPSSVDIRGRYAYVIRGHLFASYGTLLVVDLADPALPFVCGAAQVSRIGPLCAGPAGYVYIGTKDLIVVDVSDPTNPREIGMQEVSSGLTTRGLHASGSYLALARGDYGVDLFDLSDPAHPVRIGRRFPPVSSTSVWCGPTHLLVGDSGAGLLVYDYPPPGAAHPPGSGPAGGGGPGLEARAGRWRIQPL